MDLIERIIEYIAKAFTGLKPLYGSIVGLISYLFFPEKAYYLALMAVITAATMDIITKVYAISKVNGGYRQAVRSGKLFSKTFWQGTEVKIFSYLTVTLLTGLSYRVIFLKEAGVLLASFVYSVMFMREFQSNIENLCEAGADLNWLLLFAKKKNTDLMKNVEEEKGEKANDKRV